MQTLSVCLLGEPLVRDANGPVRATSKKALGVFCYLAYTGVRHSRRELAALFWGGGNGDAARASLRTTLLRMPAAMAACLAVDRESIAATDAIDVDVRRFSAVATAGDIPALDEAIDLYRGPLLAGLDVDATADFDDWLARERDRLRQIAQSAFDRLIGLHRERARSDSARAAVEREAALATARRWCAIEPAAEAAHRWLIRLYLEMQRNDAALAQYETCRRELAVAAGRAPGAETQALVERLLPATPAAADARGRWPTAAAALRHGLPATSFVGRIDELAELDRLLTEPACRLLTLHALGGSGKSRLAAVLADQVAARFTQGTAWVALEPLTSATQLPQAIALALGIELPPHAAPADALCRALSSQQRLLVLDNFEHLLVAPAADDGDAVALVLRIVREAPDVRVLVTSREVLAVQEEWIYELRGLPFPPPDRAASPGEPFAAVELFVQRARQAYAGFSAAAEWPHVARLCQLVEGLPLAIELAAAWVRTVPCGDLVGAIDRELRSLASRHRDRPPRHQSLDAVVRTSWALLQPEQQRALAPLCVFSGGFQHEAAAEVADAPLRILSALADKSLVHRRVDGRMVLHPLVRQFLRETIERDGDGMQRLQRRHAAYFAGLLARLRAQLDGAHGLDAHASLTVELANLGAAAARWDLAEQGERVAEPWLCVLLGRGLQRLALPFADRALAASGRLPAATHAQVLVHRGVALVGLGRGNEAEADLASAVALARAHALPNVLANALVHQALVGFLRDDVGHIEATLAELEAVLPSVDEPAVIVRARFYRAMHVETSEGDRAASVAYEEALALARRLAVSEQVHATLQTMLARVLIRLGELDRAEALLAEAIVVHERAGNAPRLAQALNAQATALLGGGGDTDRAGRAKELARRALTMHEQSGHPPGISAASCTLALACSALGDRAEARRLFERAIEVQSPVLRLEALVELGLLVLDDGLAAQARGHAIDGLGIATAHDIAFVRQAAVLLAASVLVATADDEALATTWLRALAANQAVSLALRRHAEARLAGAPPRRVSSPAESAPVIDRAAIDALLAALRASDAGQGLSTRRQP